MKEFRIIVDGATPKEMEWLKDVFFHNMATQMEYVDLIVDDDGEILYQKEEKE